MGFSMIFHYKPTIFDTFIYGTPPIYEYIHPSIPDEALLQAEYDRKVKARKSSGTSDKENMAGFLDLPKKQLYVYIYIDR